MLMMMVVHGSWFMLMLTLTDYGLWCMVDADAIGDVSCVLAGADAGADADVDDTDDADEYAADDDDEEYCHEW